MSKQLYYIAIVCPPAVNEDILVFKHWMRDRFGCKAALKSPAHITLVPSFLMEKRLEDDLVETLSAFRSGLGPLSLRLHNFDHFGSAVIFVSVDINEGLSQLKVALERYLAQHPALGIRHDSKAFYAHVTIANRDLSETGFPEAWAHFGPLPFEAAFDSPAFALLQLDGAHWKVVHTFEW
jgi:2'-5' RNA ligase